MLYFHCWSREFSGLYGSAVLENSATEPYPEGVEFNAQSHTHAFVAVYETVIHNVESGSNLHTINTF